jgi:hypothetical protein
MMIINAMVVAAAHAKKPIKIKFLVIFKAIFV